MAIGEKGLWTPDTAEPAKPRFVQNQLMLPANVVAGQDPLVLAAEREAKRLKRKAQRVARKRRRLERRRKK